MKEDHIALNYLFVFFIFLHIKWTAWAKFFKYCPLQAPVMFISLTRIIVPVHGHSFINARTVRNAKKSGIHSNCSIVPLVVKNSTGYLLFSCYGDICILCLSKWLSWALNEYRAFILLAQNANCPYRWVKKLLSTSVNKLWHFLLLWWSSLSETPIFDKTAFWRTKNNN